MLCILSLVFGFTTTYAQQVSYNSKVTTTFDNGQNVVLYSKAGQPHLYYYLPANLYLARTSKNIPEFLLMFYTDKSGNLSGGLLHLLFTWGLTPTQIKSIETKLKATKIEGALNVIENSSEPAFSIVGKPQQAVGILKRSLNSASRIPTLPYDKSAISFKFSAEDAKIIKTYIDNPQTLKDIKIELKFDYYAIDKGVSAKFTHILYANFGKWFIEALKYPACYKKQ